MTDTVRIKTEELTGAALRYAVAAAADVPVNFDGEKLWVPWGTKAPGCNPYGQTCWRPDRDWSQLGPLIERYVRALNKDCDCYGNLNHWWVAADSDGQRGDTLEIAICRAIAGSHFGDYADVPRELVD